MFSFKIISSVWLLFVGGTVAFVAASADIDARELDNVRTMPPVLAATLVEGARVSPTLRALLDELALSDVIVHIVGAPVHQSRRLAGTMRFVDTVGGRRYLRVTVDERLPHDVRTAILAHELQHAVEVARAAWVVDVRSFGLLYRHIGTPSCACDGSACYETIDAQRTEARVLREMRRAATADAGAATR
jgi:hypothetical protein